MAVGAKTILDLNLLDIMASLSKLHKWSASSSKVNYQWIASPVFMVKTIWPTSQPSNAKASYSHRTAKDWAHNYNSRIKRLFLRLIIHLIVWLVSTIINYFMLTSRSGPVITQSSLQTTFYCKWTHNSRRTKLTLEKVPQNSLYQIN